MNDTPADPLIREILALREVPVSALRERYLAVFGEESTSRNKDYLFKRIAYRMQEQRYGGLSPRAKARAVELADKAPVRRRPPRSSAHALVLSCVPVIAASESRTFRSSAAGCAACGGRSGPRRSSRCAWMLPETARSCSMRSPRPACASS